MVAQDARLLGITPAMKEGSDLVAFSERYLERYFDVAIAEQHAVTLAAGMACEGMKPVVAIYSTFLQRAYDQLIHDVAVQHSPTCCSPSTAPAWPGEDGSTHAGSFDISYLRCIPGMLVMTPSDEDELRKLLTTGYLFDGPGRGALSARQRPQPSDRSGPATGGDQGRRSVGAAAGLPPLVFGVQLAEAMKVAESLDATVVDSVLVKPSTKPWYANSRAATNCW